MLRRLDWSDRSAIAAVLLGLLASFLTWYAYVSAGSHIAVNAFRASILGDVFFLLIAAEALVVLMRHGVVADVLGARISDRTARIAIAIATAVVVLLQLILIAAGGRSAGAGMLLAFLALLALALAAWTRRYEAEPRRTGRELRGEELPD
jgi:Na+(H+)/acetate symporter ActP